MAWASWSKAIEKVRQKFVPSNLKRLQSSPRIFERGCTRNVTYNSIELVYFLMNFTGKATRVGNKKNLRWPEY